MGKREEINPRDQATTPASSSFSIGDEGRRVSAGRKVSTQERCKAAMRDIQADVEANKGIYPFNDGRITLQEVLRRARLSSAALEKPHHRSFKGEVGDWVAGANKRITRGARSIRKAVTARVDDANDEIRAMRQTWTEAELEYVEGREEVAALTAGMAALQREVQRLKTELAGRNVIPITCEREVR